MPEENIVYDPKEHATNQKNTATKKPTKPAKSTKNPKPAKPEKKDVVNAKAHAKDGADAPTEPTEEPVKEFKTKVNKYGFIHVPKRAWSALPFEGWERRKPMVINNRGDTTTFIFSGGLCQNTDRKSEMLMNQSTVFRRIIWKNLNEGRL
jgi:hypothetical protein